MEKRLTTDERDQLRVHLERAKLAARSEGASRRNGESKLAREMKRVLPALTRWPDRKTINKALLGQEDLQADVVTTIRMCLARLHDEFHLYRHAFRYTGRILPGALSKDIPAREFKSALLRELRATSTPVSSLVHAGAALPGRIAFVNHTGQWLKPVLRKLMHHAQPVRVEVYVCDPERVHRLEDGSPEIVDVLGVLEFLWSLPTSLELHKANENSRLDIYTYDGSSYDRRLAYFEGDLLATSDRLLPLRDRTRVQGHPAMRPGFRCMLGAEHVEVLLHGHAKFAGESSQIREKLAGGTTPLPGLEKNGPRITWTSRGFSGVRNEQSERGFDIHPAHYFKLEPGSRQERPGSEMEARPLPPPVGPTDSDRDGKDENRTDTT